jgi:glucose/arabinose dehydrogenase
MRSSGGARERKTVKVSVIGSVATISTGRCDGEEPMTVTKLIAYAATGALSLAGATATAHAAGPCDGVSKTSNTALKSVVVATGLARPLYVTAPPGDTARIFVVEQDGFIRIHRHGGAPATTTLFLDLSGTVQASPALDEMGLLGLAFDPDYATNGRFYVYYTEGTYPGGPYFVVLARYNVSAGNPDQADPGSEVRLIRYQKPGGASNHNGGQLQFGSDGFLYIDTGDGGGGGDLHGACGNGQDLTMVLGKILRIDVRGIDPAATAPDCAAVGSNYTVPSTNPFRDGPGGKCDEIWAYGLRNPWRASFDAGNGDFYIADVGQNCWEEIDWIPAGTGAGRNFGWRQMEGTHCFDPGNPSNCNPAGVICGGSPACNDSSLTLPILTYGHSGSPSGCAVTGGYAYRGCRMTGFQGTYFYGDYCSGWIKSFDVIDGAATNQQDWTASVAPGGGVPNLTSFGVDAQGEIYMTARSGTVLKLVPPFPDLEVSGSGAASTLLLDKTGDWTWEDVFLATDEPVSFYRVYRGIPNGAFTCVLKAVTPRWPAGGDATVPAAGQLFAYVVSAVNAAGEETSTGHPGTFNPTTCP